MPNWASTAYHIIQTDGKTNQLKKLGKIIKELQELPDPGLIDNGFGSTWLGNLVTKLGADWEKVHCRGSWDFFELNDGYISMTTETAWHEMSEVRHLIEEKFPNLKIYYQTEEPGMCIFHTNDSEGSFFPEKWVFDSEQYGINYFDSDAELIQFFSEDNSGIDTVDDVIKFLESEEAKNSDNWFSLNEFEVVEY